MKKKICSIALVLVMIMGMSVTSFAAMPIEQQERPVLASLDLSKREAQEVTVRLPNGETAILGAKPVGDEVRGSYPGASGDWNIYWYMVFLNIDYYINITNSTITNAWGQDYLSLACEVTNTGLSFTSTLATGYWDYTHFGYGGNRVYLFAEMNGTTLNTYVS